MESKRIIAARNAEVLRDFIDGKGLISDARQAVEVLIAIIKEAYPELPPPATNAEAAGN